VDFAAVQARANASIFKLLATDAATLDFVPVKGKFDRPHGEAFDGIATSYPRFGLPSADAANVTLNSELRYGDERFQVRSVEPDGMGWTVLTLQAAQ
jgi:hypothetical protein